MEFWFRTECSLVGWYQCVERFLNMQAIYSSETYNFTHRLSNYDYINKSCDLLVTTQYAPFYRLRYAPTIFFSILAFGFNQKQKSIKFIRRHSCQSTWSACYQNPHDDTAQMDALFKKKSLRAVNISESIHFIQSEYFGDSSKLRLKPENVAHSENSVPTI